MARQSLTTSHCSARPQAMATSEHLASSFIPEHDIVWQEVPLCSGWVSCVPSQTLAHPHPAGWWAERDTENALTLVQALLSYSCN